jgi:hypothetical protein
VCAATLYLALLDGHIAGAQTLPKTGPSPFEVISNTHLTTEVPPAEPFVRDSRPPDASLTYQPLYSGPPDRPKARTPEEVKSLQAELEAAGAHNAQRAAGRGKPKSLAKSVAKAVPKPQLKR